MPRSIALRRRIALALALLLLPSVASAHTSLRRSEPARGSVLTAPPTRIMLWFTERPQLAFSRLRLYGASGEIVLRALVADSGAAFHADIPTRLAPGAYRVQWQTASADGHRITGEISFSVAGDSALTVAGDSGAGAAALPTLPPHTPAPAAHAGHTEYRSARWLEFVALLTVLGALGFRHGVLPPLAARGVPTSDAADRARRLGLAVLLIYMVAALVRVYAESVAIHGVEHALDIDMVRPMLTTTVWGAGWLSGIIGAVLVTLGWAASRRSVTIGTPLALTGAVAMVFSPALSGHAAASRHFVPSVVFDVLHVLGAGVWLGGLVMVMFAGIPAMRRLSDGHTDAAVSALVNSFHPLALFCAPIVIAAGLGSAWIRLGGWSPLWDSAYGRVLLVKLSLAVLVVAMGTYNSVRARRRLGGAEGTRHIRATASVELLLAALVLAATTVLVTTPVPSELTPP